MRAAILPLINKHKRRIEGFRHVKPYAVLISGGERSKTFQFEYREGLQKTVTGFRSLESLDRTTTRTIFFLLFLFFIVAQTVNSIIPDGMHRTIHKLWLPIQQLDINWLIPNARNKKRIIVKILLQYTLLSQPNRVQNPTSLLGYFTTTVLTPEGDTSKRATVAGGKPGVWWS